MQNVLTQIDSYQSHRNFEYVNNTFLYLMDFKKLHLISYNYISTLLVSPDVQAMVLGSRNACIPLYRTFHTTSAVA